MSRHPSAAPSPSADDRELLRRVARRDREAFTALYHRYYRRLFGYLLRLTRRFDLVEELVNDVMFLVWQKAPGFEGRSKPSTWILGIAYHKALRALERIRGEPLTVPPESVELVDDERPERRLERRRLREALEGALASLSPEQRAVVELTYFVGCSYREIAEITGSPVNTVKTRMFYARRRLQKLLPELGGKG